MLRTIFGALIATAVLAVIAREEIGEEMKCAGMISKVEGENLTVKDAMTEHQMKIEPATKITSGGKPVMPTDLRVGQKVRCVCEKKEEALICTELEIMRDTP